MAEKSFNVEVQIDYLDKVSKSSAYKQSLSWYGMP